MNAELAETFARVAMYLLAWAVGCAVGQHVSWRSGLRRGAEGALWRARRRGWIHWGLEARFGDAVQQVVDQTYQVADQLPRVEPERGA